MISIVIPLYNKAAYISQSIQSIVLPQDVPCEIVVIDDASTDDSLRIVRELAHPHLRIIQNSTNIGLSATRNCGIQAAKYDYIAFLDADDLWHSSFIPTVLGLIQQFPQAGLWGTAYWEDYGANHLRKTAKNLATLQPIYLENAFEYQCHQPLYCFSSIVIHRRVFAQVGGFNPQVTFAEDVEFNLRALAQFGLAYSPVEACYYRTQLQGQLTFTPIAQRGLPDFDAFEEAAQSDKRMKAYLDVNRYFLGLQLKKENQLLRARQIWAPIAPQNLTWKMRMLMRLPNSAMLSLQWIKQLALKLGVRFTSYS